MEKQEKRQSSVDIGHDLYLLIGVKSLGLTARQAWMLNYLYLQWCEGNKQWISPTKIGQEYGLWLHHGNKVVPHSYHSAAASPTLKKLVEKGLIERNERGLYRYINN